MKPALMIVGAVFIFLLLATTGLVQGEFCFADLGCVRSNSGGLTIAKDAAQSVR